MPLPDLLHSREFQSRVNHLSRMEAHSRSVLERLDVHIEETEAAAPCRSKDYRLQRVERRTPVSSQRERLLEKAIWAQWGCSVVSRSGVSFCGDACRYILTFQMPLQGARAHRSWGKVDLVGVSSEGLPAVVELKCDHASETPLRILTEALAYAVAVRKGWSKGPLREQWASLSYQDLPSELPVIPLIGLAPSSYWRTKIGAPGKRATGQVFAPAWGPFGELCAACAKRGFPVSFFEFEIGDSAAEGLPMIHRPVAVRLPTN